MSTGDKIIVLVITTAIAGAAIGLVADGGKGAAAGALIGFILAVFIYPLIYMFVEDL